MFESLPRSIRWKIHLDLLQDVPLTDTSSTDVSTHSETQLNNDEIKIDNPLDPHGCLGSTPVNDRTSKAKQPSSLDTLSENLHLKHGSSPSRPLFNESFSSFDGKDPKFFSSSSRETSINQEYLRNLQYKNNDLLREQRLRFQHLLEKHYWKCSPLAIIEDAEVEERKSSDEEDIPTGTTSSTSTMTNVVADPLSMMAMLQEKEEEQETARRHLERKERALAARNKHTDTNNKTQTRFDGAETQVNNISAGSRWTDFYSSRDVIDIIEKDLSRLPGDHHLCFCRRKNICEGNQDLDENSLSSGRKERLHDLSQILFVYAKEHPALGYRQGMHEILSLILLSIEIDLLESDTQLDSRDKSVNRLDCGNSFTEKLDVQHECILDQAKSMHDAYIIFETIMSQLSPAYEVRDPDLMESQSPMEQMGRSILNKIKVIARDERLYSVISQINVPPELYSTRWIRLMFSREVIGYENVMMLWDIFFKLRSTSLSAEDSNTSSSSNRTLMDILETTAVSMIFLIRDKLLPGQSLYADDGMYNNNFGDERDPNELIELLMNYPPLHDPSKLIEVLLNMDQSRHIQHRVNMYESNMEMNPLPYHQSQIIQHIPPNIPIQNQHMPSHLTTNQHHEANNIPRTVEAQNLPTEYDSNYLSSKVEAFSLPISYGRGASVFVQATENALSKVTSTMSQKLKKLSTKSEGPTLCQPKSSAPKETYSIQYRNIEKVPDAVVVTDEHDKNDYGNNVGIQNYNQASSQQQSLVVRLESSANKLTSYFRNQMQNGQQIPETVWEAMVEIDSVRNELM